MSSLGAWLLLPAAALAWYPAVRGLPLFPLALAVPLAVMLLRPSVRFMPEMRRALLSLAAFATVASAVFLVQYSSGVHVNRRMEIYIFAMNIALGPMAFVLAARLPPEWRRRILYAATATTLALVFLAIVASVGLNITAFDKQNRLPLLLVSNSMAPTSISLVLGLLFVANLALPAEKGVLNPRFVLLVLLGFQIYLLSTRFVFLVVAGALAWMFLRTLRRGAVLRLLLGAAALGLAAVYVTVAGGEANSRFLSELQTFELITAPLTDTSLAIRVVQWLQALQDIPTVPLGYGYMTFVSRNVYVDPVIGPRGFNTHNEFLLQILALGWIAPLILALFVWQVVRIHRRHGNLGAFVPVLIGLGISAFFETFSNNPNAINAVGLSYLVLGLTLPPSLRGASGSGAGAAHEVVPTEERAHGQVAEDALLHEG